MRKVLLFIIGFAFSAQSFAQQTIPSAKPGVEYGAGVQSPKSISVPELEKVLVSDSLYSGVVIGKVVEVCLKKGCFMKVEREGNADPIMVRFKDYGFFMPNDILGKTVLLSGEAKVSETSIERLKHFAEDAGKSAEEIAKITVPKSDIEIMALGVKVVN
jgi:hypothetical protein